MQIIRKIANQTHENLKVLYFKSLWVLFRHHSMPNTKWSEIFSSSKSEILGWDFMLGTKNKNKRPKEQMNSKFLYPAFL